MERSGLRNPSLSQNEDALQEIRCFWLRRRMVRHQRASTRSRYYCSFAYSALASFKMGMSGSASFQRAKKSW